MPRFLRTRFIASRVWCEWEDRGAGERWKSFTVTSYSLRSSDRGSGVGGNGM